MFVFRKIRVILTVRTVQLAFAFLSFKIYRTIHDPHIYIYIYFVALNVEWINHPSKFGIIGTGFISFFSNAFNIWMNITR